MKKKHAFVAIIIWVVGLVYGSIFNFIVREENPSIGLSIMQGFFVGILSTILYIIILLLGIGFDEKYYKLGKFVIVIITVKKALATELFWCDITIFITNGKEIMPSYAWIYIVNIVFAILIVVKSNCDAKVLRKSRK